MNLPIRLFYPCLLFTCMSMNTLSSSAESLFEPGTTEHTKINQGYLSKHLSLSLALQNVLKNDYQLTRSKLEASALAAEAESKNVLPDPVLFAGIQNIPVNSFDLDQEAMTQLRVGVKQMFPKGDSLNLQKSIVQHAENEQNFLYQLRVLSLRQQTEITWLEAWYWQKSQTLIEADRVFLTQMLEFMQSVYQLGGNNQSDLLGAELELIKLDETLLDAQRQYQQYRQSLNALANVVMSQPLLDDSLIHLPKQEIPKDDVLSAVLASHPAFQVAEENSAQLLKKVTLSEQDFKPQWGLELSYGLRDDMPDGTDRANLLSAGLSVQLPLFSRPQKTQAVRALKYKHAASENKRQALFQQVRFDLRNLGEQYQTTLAQRQLYETKILPTLSKQKDSAIQSYQADKGDFKVVTDLYLKEQSTRIKYQRLRVNEQILLSKINYWLSPMLASANAYQTSSESYASQSLMEHQP